CQEVRLLFRLAQLWMVCEYVATKARRGLVLFATANHLTKVSTLVGVHAHVTGNAAPAIGGIATVHHWTVVRLVAGTLVANTVTLQLTLGPKRSGTIGDFTLEGHHLHRGHRGGICSGSASGHRGFR